jgi:hypothetical protein
LSVLEYCLEKSSIVLELPRGWKVVQLICLEVEIYMEVRLQNRTPYGVAPSLRLSHRL